ncbi:class I SAM-dependent methyltransferase [Thermodesulfobacteriota bacterium]
MNAQQLDQEKAEAFADGMVNVLNNACLALMLSIGHRTELFDKMANLSWATSEKIAETASLNERYVREWLASMVVGRVVEYDPAGKTYRLPAEHAAFLTRAATPDNLAVFMQYVAVMGNVEDDIVDCFRNGGGVPYSGFPRFHEVMAEDSGQSVLPAIVDHILPLAPGLVEAMKTGIDVLDLGCGSGRAINLMAKAFPNSRFTGYDISDEALAAGRAEAERMGLSNADFTIQDVTIMDDEARYDLITAFDAIHDQAAPATVLSNIVTALRSGGVFLMQDLAGSSHLENNLEHPIAQFLYTISTMHCMTVSLAQDGAGLGTLWGEELAQRMLAEAGFSDVSVQRLAHDIQNSYYICRNGKR